MKIFSKKLVYFILPIIILALMGEYFIRKIPNDYSLKKDYLENNSNEIEALFLGNSHIYYGINPKYLKIKAFNAGYLSQTLDYDYEILKLYNDKLPKLKYLIIPIDYFSLNSSIQNGSEAWRVKNYEIYYNIHKENVSLRNNVEFLSSDLRINLKKLYLFYINKKSLITSNALGWGNSYSSKIISNLSDGKKNALGHTFKDEKTYKKNTEILKKIILFGNKKNVKIIFITCPTYKSYYENLDLNQLSNVVRTITDFSKQQNIYYYNWIKDKSFQKNDFYDAHHLNEIGAKKFTLKIDSILSLKKI